MQYFAEAPPFEGTVIAPEVQAGLLRHADGRVVTMFEPAQCDSCGAKAHWATEADGKYFMHPSRFRRNPVAE